MFAVLIATVTSAPPGAAEILQRYLPFQVLGLLVVVFALTLLCVTCLVIGSWFGRTKTRAAAPAPEASAPATLPLALLPPPEEKTDPRILAAIAAAITVTLDQPYRIIDIHEAGHTVGMTSAWAIEGRFQLFSSHKVR